MNWHNDNNAEVCAWTQALMHDGLIPPGVVDCRSITEVKPDEIENFTQCHFFNGISGWSLALQLAGWPADRPVWCTSLPCQPWSCAGSQKGTDDSRNLWRPFFRLVQQLKPVTIFGEQVPAAIGLGWLDGIFTDLEAEGYTCGAVVLGAHSVGAPHKRNRIYWVADRQCSRWTAAGSRSEFNPGRESQSRLASGILANAPQRGQRTDRSASRELGHAQFSQQSGILGNTSGPRLARWQEQSNGEERPAIERTGDDAGGLGNSTPNGCEVRPQLHGEHDGEGLEQGCVDGGMDNSDSTRSAQKRQGPELRIQRSGECGPEPGRILDRNFWSDAIWHPCLDYKWRRISPEPSLFPLAPGLPYKLGKRRSARPALLKGSGNAICPQTAAAFIQAFLQHEKEIA